MENRSSDELRLHPIPLPLLCSARPSCTRHRRSLPLLFFFFTKKMARKTTTRLSKSRLSSRIVIVLIVEGGDGRFEVNSMSGLAYVRVDDYPSPIDDNCP